MACFAGREKSETGTFLPSLQGQKDRMPEGKSPGKRMGKRRVEKVDRGKGRSSRRKAVQSEFMEPSS